jgi:acyl-CoA synthetase (AMP-forming)/AMP-acid ligase II
LNITDILATHAADRPDHPAIESGDRVITYGALGGWVDAVAANLQAAGIASGDVVGVMLPDCAEHLVVLLALARAGAVMVAIDGSLPEAERQRALAGATPRAVIAPGAVAAVGNLPHLALGRLLLRPGVPFRRPALAADHPLMIVQSSGTTGTPKAFVWSHARMLVQTHRHRDCLGLDWRDRYLALVRMTFFWQRELCLILFGLGATIVVNRASTLDGAAAQANAARITLLAATPSHLAHLLDLPAGPQPLFPSLRVLLVGSAPLAHQRRLEVRRRLTPNFYEQLGTNEAGLLVLGTPANQDARPEAIGRVVAGVEAQVVDAEGRPLPPGAVGLVGFRGAGFPTGYVDDPAATAGAFRDGWFYPGDLAAIDAAGFFHFRGRADDIINNDGVKFYPIEVETALLAHPAVIEAAVVGWPHDRLGQVAVAFLVTRQPLAAAALDRHCRRHVAGFKVPHWFVTVDRLPRTASGKVLKRDLRPMFRAMLDGSGGAAQAGRP